jgi:hypothetical protein
MKKLFYHESTKAPRLNGKKGLTGQAKTRKKRKISCSRGASACAARSKFRVFVINHFG